MKRINLNKFVMLLALLFAMNVNAQVSFYVNEVIFGEGSCKQEVEICMQNEPNNITAVQFDVYLSEGLSLLTDEDGFYLVDFANRTTSKKHSNPECSLQNDGAVRVVCASPKFFSFTGNDGAIFKITIGASNNFKGLGKIELKNCVATGADSDGSNIVQYKPADYEATIMDYATGIEETFVNVDANAEYYTLQGVKVEKENLTQGVYVKKTGNKSTKVVVK